MLTECAKIEGCGSGLSIVLLCEQFKHKKLPIDEILAQNGPQ